MTTLIDLGSGSNTPEPPQKARRTSKVATILALFVRGHNLNRFDAEKHHDHCLHSTVSSLPISERPSKALATIKAKFAMHGHAVHDGDIRDFLVVQSSWGHTRHCRDYAALIAFGRQLGVL